MAKASALCTELELLPENLIQENDETRNWILAKHKETAFPGE